MSAKQGRKRRSRSPENGGTPSFKSLTAAQLGYETVFLVDPNPVIRAMLGSIARSGGYGVAAYESAEAFLEEFEKTRRGCLVAEMRLPGRSGLELQAELRVQGATIPIIFVTSFRQVAPAVEALKHGAVDYVDKLLIDHQFLSVIRRAIAVDADLNAYRAQEALLVARLTQLTPREREVLANVSLGMTSRTIAAELGIETRTVEIHRFRGMRKLGISSVASLVRVFLSFPDCLQMAETGARTVELRPHDRPISAATAVPLTPSGGRHFLPDREYASSK